MEAEGLVRDYWYINIYIESFNYEDRVQRCVVDLAFNIIPYRLCLFGLRLEI